MDKETARKIIEAANQAPSGGNSQPWKFVVTNSGIDIVALPEKDHPVLNFRSRGTYVAHGALMENMRIAAGTLGYEPTFALFPETNISIRASFQAVSDKNGDDLMDAIFHRHTNRKIYEAKPLGAEEKEYLFRETQKFPECELITLEGTKMQQIAEALASDILVFLQNQRLHKLLFDEIIWNQEEEKQRGGLYVKTMEVTPPKSFVFKALKNWNITKFAHKLKLPTKMYEETARKITSSALVGFIVVPDADTSFIHAGELMQNIWLRAAKKDLGFQLITGILFLWQQANFGKQDIFSEEDKDIINAAHKKLTEVLDIQDKVIAIAFRIGKADSPLAVSSKRPPEVEWN